jgi:hypothetical protein
MLEAEGVEFDDRGYTSWDRFGWEGLTWFEVEDLLDQART